MTLTPNLKGLASEGDKILKSLLEQAYKRGAEDMRVRILSAANGGIAEAGEPTQSSAAGATRVAAPAKPPQPAKPKAKARRANKKAGKTSSGRAPRGALDAALEKALTESPGLEVKDYVRLTREIEPRISETSVGNTLRRLKGKKYRSQGKRWFLIKK